MPYVISKFDGTTLTTVADGVVDNDSSTLSLVGKNVTDYGTVQNDNFLWLLENFSAITPPPHQLKGQIWFDKNVGVLRPKVYDGGHWRTIGITEIGETQPSYLQAGDLWFDTSNKQLWVKTSAGFSLVGPELVKGYDNTKWSSQAIKTTNPDISYPVIALAINGQSLMVVSDNDFDVNTSESLYTEGITHIYKGLTFKSDAYALHGRVEDDRYGKLADSETVTGQWSFTNSLGIKLGQSSQGLIQINNNNLILKVDSPGSIVLASNSITPLVNGSNLGSSTLRFGTVYTNAINAGGTGYSGVVTGDWALAPNSKFNPLSDVSSYLGASNLRWNSVYLSTLSAGSATTLGTLEGSWTVTTGGQITSPKFQTTILTSGSPSTSGQFVGNWGPAPGSTLQATSIAGVGGVGGADVEPNAGTIAQRTLSGDIKAVKFYGDLVGNSSGVHTGAVTGNVTGNLTGNSTGVHTGAVTGNVTGNLTGNSAGSHTGPVSTTSITAGSDTTVGDILGFWKLSPTSKLQLNYITSGAPTNIGTIEGDWRLASGSNLQASQLISNGQPVSASKDATNNTIAQRTADGSLYATNFYGNMIGTVTGKAATAGIADKVANALTRGSYLTGSPSTFDGSVAATWSVNASDTSANNTIVARDSNGSFSANQITLFSGAISYGTITSKYLSITDSATIPTLSATTINGTLNGLLTRTATGATTVEMLRGNMADNDMFRILIGGTASDQGYVEFATADNGTEPIYVRQYSGAFNSMTRSATLLGSDGSTSFPVSVSTPSLIASGGTGSQGTISGQWSLASGARMQATYADVAEKYTSDADYEPGTVVVFGGGKEVTLSTGYMNQEVAGIVSTNPAHLLNSETEGVAIALTGRVPCKVVGTIKKGSLLVSSNVPGVATAETTPLIGTVIAKAMESYNSVEVGVIEVMIWRG